MICEVAGCVNNTREDKPYCPVHVSLFPYVQGLLGQMEARSRELAAVREHGWRKIDPDGIVATDLMDHLRTHGPRTIQRLRRECLHDEPEDVVNAYKTALVRAKRVTIDYTTRGNLVLYPVHKA